MSIYLDISRENTDPISLSKASLIGTFRTKLTSDSKLLFDDDFKVIYQHRYCMKQLDLEKGYTNYLQDKKFLTFNKLKCLTNWMREPSQQTNSDVLEADFACTDATLSFLLRSYYDTAINYHIIAERDNDTIYIKINRTSKEGKFQAQSLNENKINNAENHTVFNDWTLRRYCELKLRKIFTKNDDGTMKENRFNENVPLSTENSEDFEEKINYVLSTQLGKHRILFTEEIDSLEKSQDDVENGVDHKLSTVRFKLSRMPKMPNAYKSNEIKRLWWSQNVFGCTKKLVVGYHLYDFICENVHTFEMSDLKNSSYSQEAGLNNLDSILTFIKSSFQKLNTNLVILSHYPYTRELKCKKGIQKVLTF